MNVIKIRNQKIDRVKINTYCIRFDIPMWLNCHIRKVSTETFFCGPGMADYINITKKPKYQKINYITIMDFCRSCRMCFK